LPALIEIEALALRPTLFALAVSTAALSLTALVIPRGSAERPLAFRIEYFRDLADNKALWAIADKDAPVPSSMPGRWMRIVPAYTTGHRWTSPAPLLNTPSPRARVIKIEPSAQDRRVRLVLSPGGGDAVTMRFPADAKILAMGIAGAPVAIPANGKPDQAVLRCTGRSCDGLTVDLLFADRAPVTAELYALRFALPPQAAPLTAARPRNAQPQYAPDQAIVRSRVTI
jgi:hypothetical protein